jgi:2-oxoglutarate dehydrogenase E2 component (dihydrolipoamide succinyltransferase)
LTVVTGGTRAPQVAIVEASHMAVELKIPSAGESISEVQIGHWLKAEGDYVAQDEPVVELETDKASMELPAPASGILAKRLKQTGDIVPVGSVIALIEESARPAERATAPSEREVPTSAAPAGRSPGRSEHMADTVAAARSEPRAAVTGPSEPEAKARGAPDRPRVMPAARRALAEAGLSPADVKATGPGGRLLKEDVQRHVAQPPPAVPLPAGGDRAKVTPETAVPPAATAVPPEAGPAPGREEELVPMTMLRRRIAQRLVQAQQTMAMLTTFNEVDMSAVQRLRAEEGEQFERKYHVRLGLMSFFVKAAIDALKAWPMVNAEVRGTDIAYKNYFDIGIAVSTEQGLVVPVVRNAERLSFAEVEQTIADLAQRARERKITIEELQGGTFTITNGGVFGSLLATPIINPPQSAILGLHAIQDRPVVCEGQVVIRPMMYIALTYDHRLIDGRESVSFLKRVKDCIEDPTRMLVEV